MGLRGMVAGKSTDWDISDPLGHKWRCKMAEAGLEPAHPLRDTGF